MPEPLCFPADLDSFSSCASENLDEQKFLALERFWERVKVIYRQLKPAQREDLEISFLERCDEALIKTFSGFLDKFKDWMKQLHDNNLRDQLVARVSVLEEMEEMPVEESIEACFYLLEELEDVAESWLTVTLLAEDRLQAIYQELKLLQASVSSSEYDLTNSLRGLLDEFIAEILLFKGEDVVRVRLLIGHLEIKNLLVLLQRLLQAQLEYGQYLQEQCLAQHPEILQKVKMRLNQEVGRMAQEVVKL